jgi:hypothetical protein
MFLKSERQQTQFSRTRNGKSVSYTRTKVVNHFSCDNCGELFTRRQNGNFNKKVSSYCNKCPGLSIARKKGAITRRNQAIAKRGQIKNTKSYPEIFVGDDYPYRPGELYIRQHIYVMEMHIKKRIPKGMVVHHIDGDKTNNILDNLILCSIKDHNRCHAKIEQIVFELYKKGIVGFDKKTLEYYIKS